MKKMINILFLLSIFSCANQQIKPEDLQNKLVLDMSPADVIATLGIPQEKKIEESGQLQLIYDGHVLSFKEGKLNSGHISSEYKPDSVILNKDIDLAVSAYQVAAFLKDETLFEKIVEARVNRNGFTVKSNALCVALAEGFLKGTEAVLKAGFNPDLRLRTERGTYVFPESCVSLQKDPIVAEQLKKLLSSKIQTSVTNENVESNKEDNSKSSFDWQQVKDFLKPTMPPPTSRIKN